jgi:dUTP pyrophosphatase
MIKRWREMREKVKQQRQEEQEILDLLQGPLKLPVQVKKLNPNAVVPKMMTDGAAGADLTATSFESSQRFDEYGTGLAVAIPKGYVGLLFPRSSITNMDYTLKNSVGVIDSDYRGEIKFRFRRDETGSVNDKKIYQVGERIGQLVIVPIPSVDFEEVEELSDTVRGTGGYGSTGNK